MTVNTPINSSANSIKSCVEPPDGFAQWLLMAFRSKAKAHAAIILMELIAFTLYILTHWLSPPTSEPWKGAIAFKNPGYFEIKINPDLLLRFFSSSRAKEISEGFEKEVEEIRKTLLHKRVEAINSAAKLAREFDSQRNDIPYLLLIAGIDKNNPEKRIPASEDDYKYADLYEEIKGKIKYIGIVKWLEDLGSELSGTKKAQAVFEAKTLQRISARERAVAKDFSERFTDIGHDLTFSWLYREGAGWLFELIFWSIVGVLASTQVALLKATRVALPGFTSQDAHNPVSPYNTARFLLFLPKLILAPIVALVFVALVIAGLTDWDMTLSNLPIFLVFSFISGFASERLIGVLASVVNHLLPRLGLSETKMTAAYGEAARKAFNKWKIKRLSPETVSGLRETMIDVAVAQFAIALAAEKAVKDKKQAFK